MRHRLLLVALVMAGWGCATPEAEQPWYAQGTPLSRVDHFRGTPFSGPLPLAVSGPASAGPVDDASGSLAVSGATFFVSEAQVAAWEPLEATVRLLVDPLASHPILARGRLLRDVRSTTFAGAAPVPRDVRSVAPLKTLEGALDRGMTCEFSLTDPGQPGRPETLTLQLHRSQKGGELLALLSARRFAADGELLDWEQAALESAPSPDGPGLALAVPANDGRGLFVIAARVARAPQDPAGAALHAERVAAARAQAARRSQGLLASASAAAGQDSGAVDLEAVLCGLDAVVAADSHQAMRVDQRTVLLYLATRTSASLARDLALVGDVEILDSIARRTREALSDGDPPDVATLSWALDGAAWRELQQEASADEPRLGLMAVLLRHAGEVGRDLSLLGELLDGATSCSSLEKALLAENLSFLQANAPAARTRAYDWLLSRSQAPLGFSPQDDRHTRRATLRHFAETGETEP